MGMKGPKGFGLLVLGFLLDLSPLVPLLRWSSFKVTSKPGNTYCFI